jgi:hypothetical protein
VLQNALWRAADACEHSNNLGIGQLMKRRVAIRQLRRAKRRCEEMHRSRLLVSAQMAYKLEADERSHAVSEEGERHVHKRLQLVSKSLHQRL